MSEQVYTEEEAINLALSHHRAGRLGQAEAIYRQMLVTTPEHVTATRMLGVVASQCGKHDEAISHLNRAVALSPNDPALALDLAVACRAAGKVHEAESAYRLAVAMDPPAPAALAAYGQFLQKAGRLAEAAPFFERAAKLEPSEGALNQLGIALAELRRFEEAEAAFRRCIEINPNFASSYNNLGTAMLRRQLPEEAEPFFRKALAIDPNYPGALDNLGSSLIRQNRQPEAVEALEKAIAIKPDFAQAHENLAWALFAIGEWKRGFGEYEWRLKVFGHTLADLRITQPKWDGGELNGRSILVHAEAGMGDALQFVRYVPMVADRGGEVTLLCQPALARLFSRVPGVHRVVTPGEAMPQVDVQISLLSLPYIFGTTPENVPAGKTPYLSANPAEERAWAERLAGTTKRVGLVWAGNPGNMMDATRSVPLHMLGPLAGAEGVTFYSVQKGPGAAQLVDAPAGLNIVDLTADLRDFADTAAFLKNMDLVITPDTSVAHLSAALGRPTVMMLTFAADWRWMLDRSDTPWYASMRMFRQKRPGDWGEVVERVARSLKEWVRKKNS